jgi:hypothetical protein
MQSEYRDRGQSNLGMMNLLGIIFLNKIYKTREGDCYRKEFGNVYRLSEEVRDRGIARCGQWAG